MMGLLPWTLCWFPRVAVRKYNKLGSNRNLSTTENSLSHSSGGWKSESEVFAGLVPSEAVRGGAVPGLSPWL